MALFLPFAQLNESQWEKLFSIETASHLKPWSAQQFRDGVALGYECTAMLDSQGVVLAYSVFMRNVDDWELLNITVDSGQRGLGLGRQLLAVGLSAAQTTGTAGVFLELRPSNLSALALYQSQGFTQVGRRKNYYPTANPAQREDAVLMRLVFNA
jgi:ribosomal-protein-alanine N-acetyltransferase